MKKELLIGCGSSRQKRMTVDGTPGFDNLVTLDYNADHSPDIVWDLTSPDVLPPTLQDDSFDEIHAYEVLEHIGSQGDFHAFFNQFSAFWRVLKPGGHMVATCPSRHSVWAWGDPSHTRIMQPEQLIFLCQPSYDQVGTTAMSDFRFIYKADFDIIHSIETKDTFEFVLKAIKPSRIKEMP